MQQQADAPLSLCYIVVFEKRDYIFRLCLFKIFDIISHNKPSPRRQRTNFKARVVYQKSYEHTHPNTHNIPIQPSIKPVVLQSQAA